MTTTWDQAIGDPGPPSQSEPWHEPAISQPAAMTCGNCMGAGCVHCDQTGSHLVAGSGGPYMSPSGD